MYKDKKDTQFTSTTEGQAQMEKETAFSRNVVLTGFSSFFTDVSSEMIYPLLQAFVRTIMRAQAGFLGPVLGIIEGVAESTASILRVFSGYYSDRVQNRKAPAVMGYSLSSVSKLLYLIPLWVTVLLARFFDKVGKGIRTAPRDALISESVPRKLQGKAFGFQRSMDFAGAFLGTILSYLIVRFLFPDVIRLTDPSAFYPIFLIAIVPAFAAVLFLFFLKEKRVNARSDAEKEVPKPNLDLRRYDKNLQLFFAAQFIFTLGNSSNQFLLLRSGTLGFDLPSVLLMYVIFNLSTTIFATPFGSLSDRIGRKAVLVMGYSLYAALYAGFGFIRLHSGFLLWAFWPLYGVYYALTEGVEKAFVSDLAPSGSRATALGFYSSTVGIGLLPASIIAGFLFRYWEFAPFLFGGFMAALSVCILGFGVKGRQK